VSGSSKSLAHKPFRDLCAERSTPRGASGQNSVMIAPVWADGGACTRGRATGRRCVGSL